MKGQVAVESLFLILVIITATIFILGLYSNTHDITMAESIARSELNTLANSMDEAVLVKKVFLERSPAGENKIVVTTDPKNITNSDFNLDKLVLIATEISSSTRLKDISFKIN